MSVQFRNQTTGTLERAAGFTDTDAVLSATSRNPIQNKAVHAALAQKIDKTVSDLENYYNTSQVYNKQEVRDLIGSINTLTIEVVATLPTQDISSTTIYFVGPAAGTNTYDEYVYVNNTWVKIGDTQIDLSGYVTSAALTTALQSYYDKTQTDALFNDYYDKDTVDDLLDLKQDVLTFDNQPIAGSANPVTSAGIKTALDNILISGNGGSIIKVHHTAGAAAAGDTVTASKGSYSVSSTFDVSGDAIIIGFGEIGDITITATNGSETGVKIINIPCFSNYSTEVMYGLDYKSWLLAGGMNPSLYSSLDEVLADEEAVRRLMTKHDSVDYLASLLNITDEMIDTIINNDICAKWINLRDYAFDKLSANINVKAYMDEADKYGYGEWALMPQVPIMSSNTAPYGEVIKSDIYSSSYEGFYAFDNNNTTRWNGDNSKTSNYIGYHFISPIIVKKVKIDAFFDGTNYGLRHFKIQGSNDNTDWTTLYENTVILTEIYHNKLDIDIDNDTEYSYYRLYNDNSPGGGSYVNVSTVWSLQFYAWGPKGNIPIMTGNTSPYGVASASSENTTSSASTTQAAWKAFTGTLNADPYDSWLMTSNYSTGWLQYQFTNPVCAKKLWFANRNYSTNDYGRTQSFKIQASNDGTNFVDLTETITRDNSKNAPLADETVILNNQNYYLYYRLTILSSFTSTYGGCGELQIYGREMKVSVPAMTSNTAPYGEAFGDPAAYSSNYDFYRAFDKNSSTQAAYINGATQGYFGYDFGRKVAIKYAAIYQAQGTRPTTIIYSDDKVNWTDACSVYSHAANTTAFIKANDDAGEHRYWALKIVNNNNANTAYMDFFGFDYSERDWDTEHPMKYIYDHGIELKAISDDDAGFSWGTGSYTIKAPTKRLDDIELIGVSNNFPMLVTSELINCADYSYLFIKTPQFTNNTYHINYGISSTKAIGASIVAQKNLSNEIIGGLNISSATGQYYIYGQTSWNSSNCYVNEIWME